VAAYILSKTGLTTAMKLQKLVYYAQAWHLVLRKGPLFKDAVRAWEQGPMVYALYVRHKSARNVGAWPWGEASKITPDDVVVIDDVLGIYGNMSPERLSELTHEEDPWSNTPHGLEDGDVASEEISHGAMVRYYNANRLRIAGNAYQDGRISLGGVARILEVPSYDAVALLEEHGFERPAEVIQLGAEESKTIETKLRARRLLRAGKPAPSESRVAHSVIATQRIEGVDARPWFKR